jgi:hypothetical protein
MSPMSERCLVVASRRLGDGLPAKQARYIRLIVAARSAKFLPNLRA